MKINANKVNELLGAKSRIDLRIKRNLTYNAFFKDEINIGEDSEAFGLRIAAVVTKAKAQKLLQLAEEQKQINQQLVDEAPIYFKESSNSFKELAVLKNVTHLHITINSAVNSQKRTGEQLANRAKRLAYALEKELATEPDADAKEKLKKKIKTYLMEFAKFNDNPERIFRIRTDEHKDVVAMYMTTGMTKFEKLRITGGGLLVIKADTAVDENFKVVDRYYANRKSIYDKAVPIINYLDFKGFIYDEAELELLRKQNLHRREDNEHKIRPKDQKFIN